MKMEEWGSVGGIRRNAECREICTFGVEWGKSFTYLSLSNSVQEAIIEKIEQGDNRFMVGDLKQSIVRLNRV